MTMIMDTREPQSILDLFREMTSHEIKVMPITEGNEMYNTGDYAKNNVLVERKTISDFDKSFQDNHIWDQCQRMVIWRDAGENRLPVLIIQGLLSTYNSYSKISSTKRMGALVSIASRYGILVISVDDEVQFVAAVDKLFRMDEENDIGNARPFTVKKTHDITHLEHTIAGVDGVGIDRAKLIIEYTQSKNAYEFITNLPHTDLTQVKGIGKVIERNIKEEIGAY